MYCFSNTFFVIKCVIISLKILGHSCLNTSLVQLKIFLLAMIDNLITYIKNENFKDFTIEDGEK